jgi:hypothetical protein
MCAIICTQEHGREFLETIDINEQELTLIRMLVARWRVELATSLASIETDVPREMRPGMKSELEASIEQVDELQEKLNDE